MVLLSLLISVSYNPCLFLTPSFYLPSHGKRTSMVPEFVLVYYGTCMSMASDRRSPYAPRGRPSSAHSSPGKRVRWATSIGRRTGSRSPSAWKPSSRAASSPSPARPRQYRSAGRNVGFKHSKKREQLKELKRTRLAVEKLREQLSSTGNKREVGHKGNISNSIVAASFMWLRKSFTCRSWEK